MLEEPLPLLNIALAAVLPVAGAVLGWVAMTWLAERHAARVGAERGRRVGDVLFWGSAAALVAARVAAVAANPGPVLSRPLDLLRVGAGLSAWGAVLGLIVAAWWLCRRWGVRFWPLADAVALFAAVPIVLSRAACLGSGYCGGRPADPPWGILVPGANAVPRLPSDRYEVVLVVALALAVRGAPARRPAPGSVALLFLCGYGVIRAVVSLTRPEAGVVPLAVDQVVSLGVAAASGAALWLRSGATARRPPDAPTEPADTPAGPA